MKRIHCIISGDVVGVGYRSWALMRAKELGLTGWVKNREDRTVEIIAEGEQEMLEKFIRICHTGPDVSWVEDVRVHWQKATGEPLDFTVLY